MQFSVLNMYSLKREKSCTAITWRMNLPKTHEPKS